MRRRLSYLLSNSVVWELQKFSIIKKTRHCIFIIFFAIESLPGAISELVGLQIVEFISAGTPGLGGSGGSIELGSAEGRGAAWTIIGLSRFLSLSSAGASLLSVSTSE